MRVFLFRTPTSRQIDWPDYKLRNEFLKITKEGDFQIKAGRPALEKCRKLFFNLNCADRINSGECEHKVTIPFINELIKITISNLDWMFGEDHVRRFYGYVMSTVGQFARFAIL